MNKFLKRANELRDELVAARRKIHQFGGLGFDIQETSDFVYDTLVSYGLKPERVCGTGVVVTIGDAGKVFLCRADMDALPIVEQSDLPYACKNGSMHACGHDMHTAMLLLTAKVLSENKEKLKGRVKLEFQPAEEGGGGGEKMIEAGVLENPHVDAAMAIHMLTGHPDSYSGYIRYVRGTASASCNTLSIKIKGKGCHGAYPDRGVDPINIGARILTGIQELMSMELPSPENAVVTIGSFHAGAAANVIPETAELTGTIRTFDPGVREMLIRRITEIAQKTAETFRGTATVEAPATTGMCLNNMPMYDSLLPTIAEVVGEDKIQLGTQVAGSEDFGFVMEKVPSIMMWLNAGSIGEGYPEKVHHPKVRFNEDVMPIGVALNCAVAAKWLELNQE